jgi:uncharacterized protein YlxW (UPF0749 family)
MVRSKRSHIAATNPGGGVTLNTGRSPGKLRQLLARRPQPRRRWSVLVPVIAALAGLLLTTTARTAAGTTLRDDRRPELTHLITDREAEVAAQTDTAAQLRRRIDRATRAQAASDQPIRDQTARADAARADAGLVAVHGPGLTVRLDDAPRRPDGGLPAGARPDDVVVHQQDVQSVVNALWVGGAEAMTIQGVRVISTSAVRCVGNTLLLHGRVYSPPFDIAAIGDPEKLRATLAADPDVQAFAQAAAVFGLGYSVTGQNDIVASAFAGPVTLDYATAVG